MVLEERIEKTQGDAFLRIGGHGDNCPECAKEQ